MSTIVTRAGKGSPLTNAEVDSNFTNLNTDKLEGPASSVDSEIALFSGTGGKTLKRASSTGILKATSGVLGVAQSGTDYQLPIGTISGIAKGNGANALTAATAETDYVTPTGSGTLTNKTVEAGTFTNGYTEETNVANTGTTYTIDLALGSLQILTLTGNVTYTFPTPTAGKSFTLIQKQDGTGSRTVAWGSSVKWPSSTAPTITTTANKADKFVFTADGTSWWGSVAGQNYY